MLSDAWNSVLTILKKKLNTFILICMDLFGHWRLPKGFLAEVSKSKHLKKVKTRVRQRDGTITIHIFVFYRTNI